MQTEFFLVSLTLEDIPNHGSIYFVCNSWIYNAKHYKNDRIFFVNQVYYFIYVNLYVIIELYEPDTSVI
jgi:hypothetical protein